MDGLALALRTKSKTQPKCVLPTETAKQVYLLIEDYFFFFRSYTLEGALTTRHNDGLTQTHSQENSHALFLSIFSRVEGVRGSYDAA